MDGQNTTVIDLTYICNAKCQYCRWGNYRTAGRNHQEVDSLLLPYTTLRDLGIQRVVLSGGEPRLHPHLERIIAYYKDRVDDVIVITNGYGISVREINNLVELGVTGFAISIDSIIPHEEMATRKTSPDMLRNILAVIGEISRSERHFELGINSVVSHINSNWDSIQTLIEYAKGVSLDYVKFQPIFDDGYVTETSPWLNLSENDCAGLREISEHISGSGYDMTNPKEFWLDLSEIASGKRFSGAKCGLGPHKSNVINGELTMCYWVKNAAYGKAGGHMDEGQLKEVQHSLMTEKSRCKVDFHCFCNQKARHVWR